jgi:hypothetical protein
LAAPSSQERSCRYRAPRAAGAVRRRLRSLTNQLVEIVAGNLQIAGDAVDRGVFELAHFVQLAAVLEPVGERVEQPLKTGKWHTSAA